MNLSTTVLAISMACAGAVQQGEAGRRFRIEVPPYAGAGQTLLLLRDVVVPRNLPVTLRVYAIGSDGSKIYLGSTGIPAVSEDSAGVTSIGVARIIVTRGLQAWRSTAKSARTVDIEINAFTSGAQSVPNSSWSVREVQLIPAEKGQGP